MGEPTNGREVTFESHRRLRAEAWLETAAVVDNYLIRKARKLGTELPTGHRRTRLLEAAGAYETALATEATDPARVDRLEDDLLELLDAAEEMLADGSRPPGS